MTAAKTSPAHGTTMTTAIPRAVLDTNVCLDLLLFDDPDTAALRTALQSNAVVAIGNRDCRDEWQRVLQYPQLRLDDAQRESLCERYDALVMLLPDDERAPAEFRLPRCADADDQKFLQLAQAGRARWLLSRDRDLLALARRVRRGGFFEIVTPRSWALT